MRRRLRALAAAMLAGCGAGRGAGAPGPAVDRPFDMIVAGGRVVDGTGNPWFLGDVGVRGDRIAHVGPAGSLDGAEAPLRLEAGGLVVAPGFIDLQGASYDHFLTGDGRALSKVTQGITTEIMGEAYTPAPWHDNLAPLRDFFFRPRDTAAARIALDRLRGARGFGRWLETMERRGAAINVGSFLGASTVRAYAKGEAEGAATAAELDTMRAVMRRAMEDGAFGLGTALIYPPGSYASTSELIEVARAMAPYHGVYITHMRSEGDRLLEAMDEAIAIGREAGVPVEIYHLKAAGRRNWVKAKAAVSKIDSARAAGHDVAANMYPYTAGGTALAACLPPWASADGRLQETLADSSQRRRIRAELLEERATGWENLCQLATPAGVRVSGFQLDANRRHENRSLEEIASARGQEWSDALIDLTVEERGRLNATFFLMADDNLILQIRQSWMKFGTDAGAVDSAEAAESETHPRAYGTHPRVLGHFVRDLRALPLEDAVRKMTWAVASRLSLRERGRVAEGMFADLVIFDPATVSDLATYERSHRLSTGVRHVMVNGVPVLRDGTHTGARPGRALRGPGWRGDH